MHGDRQGEAYGHGSGHGRGARHGDSHGDRHGDGAKHGTRHGVRIGNMHGVRHGNRHGVMHARLCTTLNDGFRPKLKEKGGKVRRWDGKVQTAGNGGSVYKSGELGKKQSEGGWRQGWKGDTRAEDSRVGRCDEHEAVDGGQSGRCMPRSRKKTLSRLGSRLGDAKAWHTISCFAGLERDTHTAQNKKHKKFHMEGDEGNKKWDIWGAF